jgi:hypothetical protein
LAVLASGCLSGFAYWRLTEPPPAPDRSIRVVALSPSGRWIAAAGVTEWVTLLDREDPDHPRQIRVDGSPSAMAFSDDERSLAVVAGKVAIYSVASMDSPALMDSLPAGFRFSPSASGPAAVVSSSNVIRGPEPDTVILGTWAGSVEMWHIKSEKLLWQRSLR